MVREGVAPYGSQETPSPANSRAPGLDAPTLTAAAHRVAPTRDRCQPLLRPPERKRIGYFFRPRSAALRAASAVPASFHVRGVRQRAHRRWRWSLCGQQRRPRSPPPGGHSVRGWRPRLCWTPSYRLVVTGSAWPTASCTSGSDAPASSATPATRASCGMRPAHLSDAEPALRDPHERQRPPRPSGRARSAPPRSMTRPGGWRMG